MITIDEFSRVVSEVYASSMDPANWTVAMAEISRVLDATGSGLVVGAGSGCSVMLGAGMPAEAVETYGQYYYAIDFILHACENSPVGLIRGGRELVANKRNSEFYADWQSPFELTDGLFVQLSSGPTPISFAISAPYRSERFDTAERVQFIGALIPHLQQALRTQAHLAALGETAIGVTQVVDALRHGVAIIGTTRRVQHLNSAAERIFNAGDGLCIRAGNITATRTATDQHLQSSITRSVVEQRCGARSGDSLAVGRPSGKRPYVIHVVPLATPADQPSAAKALVMIVDPEQQHEPPKMLIRRLFGLTNAEADVALRVINGEGLKPIATDLALSTATVKTHLQHVFEKTDTHRQAELVRLLLAILL